MGSSTARSATGWRSSTICGTGSATGSGEGGTEREAPDPRSAREAARRGLALRHRARGVRPDDFQAFDWIIALDGHNLDALRARAPAGARARLALLRSFDPLSPPGSDVPDPYYGGPEGFALVHDLCVRAARGLLDHLRPGPPPADQRQ